ncbi:MAG: FixH family protein [Vicingaceae bacterium]|nr:FixH family protein [Vicingaceae bacterium]
MNWGYRIVLAFVLFMTFIISMVVYVSSKGADLVAEDYYMQEVNYQDIIDAKSNSVGLKDQLKITQDAQKVVVFFPKEVAQNIEGTIHFYHPQHTDKDVVKPITLNEGRNQSIYKMGLTKGNYVVKLLWKEGDKSYYIEKSCFVS